MSEVERKDRRAAPGTKHHLSVRLTSEKTLQVVCRCGQVFGGKRLDDRNEISLNDILLLVRLHSQQVSYGA